MTKTLREVLVDGDDWLISLKKLTGLNIADVKCYITTEFGDPTLAMHSIVLANGLEIDCEGEHDLPYLVEFKETVPGFDEETLQALMDEEDGRS